MAYPPSLSPCKPRELWNEDRGECCAFVLVGDECVNYTWSQFLTIELIYGVLGALGCSALMFIVLWRSGKTWIAKILAGVAFCGQDAISDWYMVFYWFSEGDKYWAFSMMSSIICGGLISFFVQNQTSGDSSGKTLIIHLTGLNFLKSAPEEYRLTKKMERCKQDNTYNATEAGIADLSSAAVDENLSFINRSVIRETEMRLIETLTWKLWGSIIESVLSFTVVSYCVISSTSRYQSSIFKITQYEFLTWCSSFLGLCYKIFDLKNTTERRFELKNVLSQDADSRSMVSWTKYCWKCWVSVLHTWFLALYCLTPGIISARVFNQNNERFDTVMDTPYLPFWPNAPNVIVPISYSVSFFMVGIPFLTIMQNYSRDYIRIPCFLVMAVGVFIISLSLMFINETDH